MAHRDRESREKRQARKQKEKQLAQRLFKEHNKKKKQKDTRRKSPEEIIGFVKPQFLNPAKYVRNPQEWAAKSYNLDRQIVDFVRWIYCLYPTPSFMFSIFKADLRPLWRQVHVNENQQLQKMIYFDWFLTMAQGGSFAKLAKEVFSKKESHYFLSAPPGNSIVENIWWAKCHALELVPRIEHAVVNRLFRDKPIEDKFWDSLLILLKREEDDVDIASLSDVMDFIVPKHYNDDKFTLKGRTFNSLIKLSNEWHRELQLKKFGNAKITWNGIPIPDWKWENKKTGETWKIEQLHTSKALYNEGRAMKHCVASYSQRCEQGQSAIFSMSCMGERELTIEISNYKQLIQARGRWNKPGRSEANQVLNKWINLNNIQTPKWGY